MKPYSFTYPLLAILLLSWSSLSSAAVSCTIEVNSGVLVDFGFYQKFKPDPQQATGTIEYICTGDSIDILNPDPPVVSITTTISAGTSGDFSNRTMRLGGFSINYNLYASPSYIPSNVVGDGSLSGPQTLLTPLCPTTGTGGIACTATVYGSIPPSQTVPSGDYVDTVTITATF